MKVLQIIALILALVTNVLAKESKAEKKSRYDASIEADSQIEFIDHASLERRLPNGTWIVFYGATWCKFTQKFTPHYLQVQERIKLLRTNEADSFYLRKVECDEGESFCIDKQGINGYPTVVLYRDGIRVEDYPDADEEEPFYQYVKKIFGLSEENPFFPPSRIQQQSNILKEISRDPPSYSKILLLLIISVIIVAVVTAFKSFKKSRKNGYEVVRSLI